MYTLYGRYSDVQKYRPCNMAAHESYWSRLSPHDYKHDLENVKVIVVTGLMVDQREDAKLIKRCYRLKSLKCVNGGC
jgi:hypothetical protein